MKWILSKNYDPRAINYPINRGDEGYKMIAEKKNLYDYVQL